MSEVPWRPMKLREMLSRQFPGAWGDDVSDTGASNVVVLRSTNLDDDGHVDLSSAAPRRFSRRDLEDKRLHDYDILLEASGGGPGKPVGRVALFRQQGADIYAASNFFRTMRADRGVADPRFLAWRLHWLHMQPDIWRYQQQTTGIINLQYSDYLDTEIILPPLDGQQRIAEIIDTIDDQIRAAMSSITKLDKLRTASIRESMLQGLECFHEIEASELHGGTRRSIGSWSLMPLGSLLSGIDAGHSPDLEDTPAGSDQWGVLKVSAVGNGVFRPEENKVVDDRALYNSAICVRRGDLLMTRANTTQLVGLSCIVEYTPPRLMLCDKTLRLRVAHPYATARYVHIVLGVDEVRRQIEIEATGTSGSMKNISQQAIRRLMIPLGSAEDIERRDQHRCFVQSATGLYAA